MPCKGTCERLDTMGYSRAAWDRGYKACRTCVLMIKAAGPACPCCGNKVSARVSPSKRRNWQAKWRAHKREGILTGCRERHGRYQTRAYGPKYGEGHRYCSVCNTCIRWEGLFCPCCGMRLRTTAHSHAYRRRRIDAKRRAG